MLTEANVARHKRALRSLYQTAYEMLEELRERIERDLQMGTSRRISTQGQGLSENGKRNKVLETDYHGWYTEALALLKQLLPDRVEEFIRLYQGDGRGAGNDGTLFTIQHWMLGHRSPKYRNSRGKVQREFSDFELVFERLRNQALIIQSVAKRFESSLFEIRQVLQADLFDSELAAAKELSKQGFARAAGSLAGVILEKHLKEVLANHNINLTKKNPTMSDFNDVLKEVGTLDIPSWRQIQRLGDIRNMCSHDKEREPTREEVEELIMGVEKYTKILL